MSELERFEVLQGKELFDYVVELKQLHGSSRAIEKVTGIGRSRIDRVLRNKGEEVAITKTTTREPKKAIEDKLNNDDIKALKELITLIEPVKEVIQAYNKSITPIIQEYNKSITIDKSKLTGDIVPRQVKTYKSVNEDWKAFCKLHDNIKIQDLYSMALIEFMEKYKKQEDDIMKISVFTTKEQLDYFIESRKGSIKVISILFIDDKYSEYNQEWELCYEEI